MKSGISLLLGHMELTKCNTVTNYKGVKMDPQTIFNCIQGDQLLCAGGFNPSDPLTNTALCVFANGTVLTTRHMC